MHTSNHLLVVAGDVLRAPGLDLQAAVGRLGGALAVVSVPSNVVVFE